VLSELVLQSPERDKVVLLPLELLTKFWSPKLHVWTRRHLPTLVIADLLVLSESRFGQPVKALVP
jgi:hypothetical protein